jgi:hypothetical protein
LMIFSYYFGTQKKGEDDREDRRKKWLQSP